MTTTDKKLEINLELDLLYRVWQEFCQLHTSLYELTCDEYIKLLASEIDDLEGLMEQKSELLDQINQQDEKRKKLVDNLCSLLVIEKPNKLKDFIIHLKQNGYTDTGTNLEKMNLLLVGIIQKIQEQNKKNQIFLNKAIMSLKELRNGFAGNKSYSTYGSDGHVK